MFASVTMSTHRPDTVPSLMAQDHGTAVLITDPRADAYLSRLKRPNRPPEDRYSRWCGGKQGFDDFAERLH